MKNPNGYREFGDINFIRGFAVLAVILFHISDRLMPLGFLGVDVFFVISGYLITWSLKRKVDSENSQYGLALKKFYHARIRKILPSVSLLTVVTAFYGLFVLTNEEVLIFAKQGLYSLLFVPNLYFMKSLNYFSQDADQTLFLHTWSLGVEEQFYAFWPLILLVFLRIKKIKTVTSLIILGSFLGYITVKSDTSAFYNPLFRAWELLSGGLVFLLASTWQPKNFKYRNLLKISIFVALVLTMALLKKDFRWLNFFVVLLSCTFMFLCDGTMKIPLLRVFEYLGRRSYSLYLYHWPPLAFLHILWIEPSIERKAVFAGVGVLLGIANFALVEEPFYKKLNVKWTLALWFGALGIVGILFSSLPNFRYKDGPKNGYFQRAWTNLEGEELKDCTTGLIESEFCKSWGANPDLLVLGDSHAGQLTYGLKKYGEKANMNFVVFAAGACHPVIGFETRKGCAIYIDQALKMVGKYKESLKAVWITGYAGNVITKEDVKKYVDGYSEFVNAVAAQGIPIKFIVDTPTFTYSFTKCEPYTLLLRAKFSNKSVCPVTLPTSELKKTEFYSEFVAGLKLRHPELAFIETKSSFCSDKECKTIDETGQVLFGDNNHVSRYGSEQLVNFIMNTISPKN